MVWYGVVSRPETFFFLYSFVFFTQAVKVGLLTVFVITLGYVDKIETRYYDTYGIKKSINTSSIILSSLPSSSSTTTPSSSSSFGLCHDNNTVP